MSGDRPGPTKPRVLVVGLDGCDRDAVDELLAAGYLPNLGALARRGRTADLENPFGMFSGPVWPTIATGVKPIRHGAVTWRPLQAGTYRMTYRGPNGPVDRPPFWSTLGAQGVRCCVVDLPNVALQSGVQGVQIIGWGQHDRTSCFATAPAALRETIGRAFPSDPEDHCDHRGATAELGRLRLELLEGIGRKVELVEWLLADQEPDLAAVVFGESHCAGHQFWHLYEARSAGDGEQRAQHPRDGLTEIYGALDTALGRLMRDVGDDTTVMVLLSHGIGPNVVVPHLIDPVLKAIDASLGGPGAMVRAREFLRRAPNRTARLALRAVGRPIEQLDHFVDGSRRFFPLPNFPSYGAVRLNLAGREPAGLVSRAEAPAVLDLLEREFHALRDVDTGRPVVRTVIRPGPPESTDGGAALPDLLVEWDLSTIPRGVRSGTVGSILRPLDETRTGGHRRDGRVIVAGPRVTAGRSEPWRAEDIAPTLAAMSGVVMGDVDGVARDLGTTAVSARTP